MYNASPLSWIGTPDISSLGPHNIRHPSFTISHILIVSLLLTQGSKVYICVLEVSNITQKDQGNYKVVAENNKGKASSTMAIKFEGN